VGMGTVIGVCWAGACSSCTCTSFMIVPELLWAAR